MARKLTFPVLIRTALLGAIPAGKDDPTRTELARRLGVSRATVSRWLNDESEPSPATMQRIEKTLRAEYKRVQSATRRINKAFNADPPPMAIPFAGERSMLHKRDKYGEKTGEVVPSDWVNYNVADYDMKAVFDFVRGLRDRSDIVQLIYKVPRGGTSLGGREYRGTARASTTPERLNPDWSDQELWERTLGALWEHSGKPLHLLYVAVLQKP